MLQVTLATQDLKELKVYQAGREFQDIRAQVFQGTAAIADILD